MKKARRLPAHFLVFQGKDDQWYWTLKAKNGERVAQSEGYTTKEHAEAGVDATRTAAAEAVAKVVPRLVYD
jgi:uncharacterized protein